MQGGKLITRAGVQLPLFNLGDSRDEVVDWRAVYESRQHSYEHRKQQMGKRLRELWAQEASAKSSRSIQVQKNIDILKFYHALAKQITCLGFMCRIQGLDHI